MLPQKIAFVDIETTGMRSGFDRIIEIGILRVEDNILTKTYHTLLNPQTHISPFIETLTGITPSILENAPTFEQVKDEIYEILQDCTFVAHNVRFDYGFLKNEFRRFETTFSPKQLCTVKLSKALFPTFRKHNLDSLMERFSINCDNRHRAFDDAKVLWEFYQKVLTLFPQDKIEEALKRIMKRPSIPLNISTSILDSLPSSAGVYILYGANDLPLYIGKSINIRDRVLSHFSSDHTSPLEMKISQQIERVEAISTAGELGALIKEASLIKEMQPLYNRKLRLSRKLFVLRNILTKDGYSTVAMDLLNNSIIDNTDDVLGIFRSKKQIKDFLITLTEEYNLCERILGLEHTKSACFGYRLGRCKGACTGKEAPTMYNLRSLIAFSKNKLKAWPFNGPICIEEGDDEKEAFLIDKWCYLGSIKKQQDDFSSVQNDYNFDLDTYKILESFLRSEKNLKKIKTLKDNELSTYFPTATLH
jgi:DNA polymerase III subunit epsilon